ncbi:MAG: HAD-IIIA family hydrolase [Desulfobacterota bacterium]|nr:HAD-IIIA family hydrolase [Thermodesulfobacteriota bacterium]
MHQYTLCNSWPKEVVAKASRVQLLVLDVDGVLTNGSIIYSEHGENLKVFHAQDGHGIKLLLRAGIHVAIITGRSSPAVTARAENLGITDIYLRALRKIEAYEELLRKKECTYDTVCVVGDDLPDIPLLQRCGLAIAVPNSVPEVKSCVDYITTRQGGDGAVREVCDLILKARGLWQQVTERYFMEKA